MDARLEPPAQFGIQFPEARDGALGPARGVGLVREPALSLEVGEQVAQARQAGRRGAGLRELGAREWLDQLDAPRGGLAERILRGGARGRKGRRAPAYY